MELQIGEALTAAEVTLAAPTLKTMLDYREEDTKREGAFEVRGCHSRAEGEHLGGALGEAWDLWRRSIPI